MNKIALKAASIHFAASASTIAVIIGSIIFWFFPFPFLQVDDTTSALKIMLGVDICLGPLLTFVLYKPGKKGLWFDLVCVVFFQVIAMFYGAWAIYDSRPAYLIFYGDSFYLADHKKVNQQLLTDKNLVVGAFDRPKVVASILQGDASSRLTQAMDSMAEGTPIHFNARYFHPMQDLTSQQLNLLAINPSSLPQAPIEYTNDAKYRAFTVVSSKQDIAVIVDNTTLSIVAVLNNKAK